MGININAAELYRILDMTPAHHNIMLVGKHGIGKSRIVSDFFKTENKTVVTLFLGQMSDPGDIIGLPALNAISGKTEFRLPWWFPEDSKPIVLFLDELNRARPEILQCIMDLTLNKMIVGRALPAGSQIVSAVNEGEEYQLTDLDPALISRFNVYYFNPTPAEWLVWAEKSKLNKLVVDFIADNPDLLDSVAAEDTGLNKTPDRRSWERVSDILANNIEIDAVLEKAIAGIVGAGAAVKFARFSRAKVGLSPLLLLKDFQKYIAKIEKAKVHELAALNEGVFRILEAESSDETRKLYVNNLEQYVMWLVKEKQREALAQWTTLFDSLTYPNAKIAIMRYAPTIMANLEDFIRAIKL